MNPIQPTWKNQSLHIIVLSSVAALSLYFYSVLPERVPIHWNFAGEVDGWGPKGMSAFGFPAIIVAVYLVMVFVGPRIDPKKEQYELFARTYHKFTLLLLVMFAAIYLITNLNGLGYHVPVDKWVPGIIGAAFILMGNYMSKLKHNYFIGIRTPWTLASEEVWNKTHRVGGKMFMLGGLMMVLQIFTPVVYRMPLFIAAMALIIAGTIGYSYWVYRKDRGGNR